MRIIEISESKHRELAEGIGEMLSIGKRLMNCVSNLDADDDDDERPVQYNSRRPRQQRQQARYGQRHSQPQYEHESDYMDDPYM